MKDKRDRGTIDWVAEPDRPASALKGEKGNLQLPLGPANLLRHIALHAIDQTRDPVELIQDINDATAFWLVNNDKREQMNYEMKRKIN